MVTTENSLGLRALRLPHIRRPKSWQFSSPPARLRHQASLQPPRQRALRLICYIDLNFIHLIKCTEWPVGLPSEHLFQERESRKRRLLHGSEEFCSFRRIATRYGKLGASFMAFIQLAAVRVSLRLIESAS